MIKDAYLWIASIGALVVIVKTVGQGSIIAFRKLSAMTDTHRATLIVLNVFSCIAYLSFTILRWMLPLNSGVPLLLLAYLILEETDFCISKYEITRSRIFWGSVYPAMNFTFFFMEWYVRVSLNHPA